jgi:hypothetical protein
MATAAPTKRVFGKPVLAFSLYFFYLLFLLTICFKSYRSPQYNWDILPYMAVMLSYDDHSEDEVHQRVYHIAEMEIPQAPYQSLIDSNNSYRKLMHQDAGQFAKNFPFYVVKPFYTYASYVFYKAGVPLTKATIILSLIGYLGIGMLVLTWLRKYTGALLAVTISTAIMCLPFLLHAAKLSTPDAFSSFILLLSAYLLLEKKDMTCSIIFLLIAVTVRLDNILPCLAILSGIYFFKLSKDMSLAKYLIAITVAGGLYFIISWQVKAMGWSAVYFPDFIEKMNPSHIHGSILTKTTYMEMVKSQLDSALYFSQLPLFLLLFLLLVTRPDIDRNVRLFLILTGMVMIIRFLAQPLVSDRFYIAYYLVAIVLTVKYIIAKSSGVTAGDRVALI